ncbi:lysophospholipase L1-like esterase [Siphonobacter sp. SORGH_AS 1065]|nr:lysophospholipase L1-like esterase [Siphonobacter sp. SORGH_AS_1065]
MTAIKTQPGFRGLLPLNPDLLIFHMRIRSTLLIYWLLIPGLILAQPSSLKQAQLVKVRAGLPHFFEKIKTKEKVRIGYLGGSITEASGGWRDQSLQWLQKQYPQATFTGINAGVGGTGSDLGVFRVEPQVLALKPDLVFVEFAVNDQGKKPEQIYRAMEGIVRKIWRQNPAIDICFVYTLTADLAPYYQRQELPPAALAMEEIAEHYDVPGVCLGLEVARLAQEGKLIFKGKPEEHPQQLVFSADNVHPYPETGQALYTQALGAALRKLASVQKKERAFVMPAPFVADHWEAARMVPLDRLARHGSWQVIKPGTDSVAYLLRNRFSYLLKSTQPGDYLEVRMKGLACGLYDVVGPGCGSYEWQMDQQTPQLIPRFDSYATYYRSHFFVMPTSPEQAHVIRFRISGEKLNKADILSKRNQRMDDSRRFEENAGYAGQLLLVGDLIP